MAAINPLGSFTGTNMIAQSANMQNEENKTDQFQLALDKALDAKDEKELHEATKEYEAYFINTLFKQMRSTVNYAGGLFERSSAEVLYQEMLDEEYAKLASENGSFGLANAMYNQLKNTI